MTAPLLAAAVLTGCSSSEEPSLSRVGQLQAERTALQEAIDGTSVTSASEPRPTGSATYEGVMIIDSDNGLFAIGEVDLAVDFATPSDAISGSADNFRTSQNAEVEGGLTFSNGSLSASSSELTFDVDGTLTTNATYGISGVANGDFYGPQYDYVDAIASGSATRGGSAGTFQAEILAER